MPFISSFTPPTSSLYQFMALSGLVVFMFFKYLRYTTTKALWERESLLDHAIIEEKAKIARYQAEGEIRAAKVKSFESDLEKVKAAQAQFEITKEKVSAAPDPSKFDEAVQSIECTIKTGFGTLDAQGKLLAEESKTTMVNLPADKEQSARLNVLLKEREQAESLNKKAITYDRWVSVISLIASAVGFALWYFQIQQYQDLILYHQAIKP